MVFPRPIYPPEDVAFQKRGQEIVVEIDHQKVVFDGHMPASADFATHLYLANVGSPRKEPTPCRKAEEGGARPPTTDELATARVAAPAATVWMNILRVVEELMVSVLPFSSVADDTGIDKPGGES